MKSINLSESSKLSRKDIIRKWKQHERKASLERINPREVSIGKKSGLLYRSLVGVTKIYLDIENDCIVVLRRPFFLIRQNWVIPFSKVTGIEFKCCEDVTPMPSGIAFPKYFWELLILFREGGIVIEDFKNVEDMARVAKVISGFSGKEIVDTNPKLTEKRLSYPKEEILSDGMTREEAVARWKQRIEQKKKK